MNEIWRDIEGFEGLYQVSNIGRVKSLRDKYGNYREKIMKFGKLKNGYLYVILYKEGNSKHFLAHRLVAQAFLDNPNNLPMINHKDENKENNCVSNLEWCTNSYNQLYGSCTARRVANTDYKLISEKLINRQDLSKKVYQYDKKGNLIKIWNSTMECGRQGFNQGNIVSCCNGSRKSAYGFIWSYVPIEHIS